MSSIGRGSKNAFRNVIRTVSIAVIVGLSIGLALVMILSLQAVQGKIDDVKSSIGNTITIAPAGARGFEGGGEPLTETDIKAVSSLPHVVKTTRTLSGRLTPSTDTSLQSAIEPGSLGQRQNQSSSGQQESTGGPQGSSPNGGRPFTVPIFVTGTTDVQDYEALSGNKLTIKSGKTINTGGDANVALVGTGLADKNNLKAGASFQAYNTTITVSGVFDAGNRFANSGMILPLKTLQRLSRRTDEVSSAQIQVDSIGNAESVQKAIKTKLGDKADVITPQDTSSQALSPLENIKTIATYSLIGAPGAGAVIIFLSMLMIVRERRKEIGVLKAIGASNIKVVLQFISEAFMLTILGTVVGTAIGFVLSNPILNTLVSSNQPGTGTAQGAAGAGFGGMRMMFAGPGVRNALQGIHASIGYDVLLYGLLAALGIAVIGSAIPAWVIARIRPAEVMRSE